MYHLFLGIALLQQFRPYFRKHISTTLDPHEYFLINTSIIMAIILMYVAYLLTTKTTTLKKLHSSIQSLSFTEVMCIVMLSCLTVVSGLFIFDLDKNYNTPLINSIYMKSISTIAILGVGVFIFRENYKLHQFLGMFMIISGIFLTSQKSLPVLSV